MALPIVGLLARSVIRNYIADYTAKRVANQERDRQRRELLLHQLSTGGFHRVSGERLNELNSLRTDDLEAIRNNQRNRNKRDRKKLNSGKPISRGSPDTNDRNVRRNREENRAVVDRETRGLRNIAARRRSKQIDAQWRQDGLYGRNYNRYDNIRTKTKITVKGIKSNFTDKKKKVTETLTKTRDYAKSKSKSIRDGVKGATRVVEDNFNSRKKKFLKTKRGKELNKQYKEQKKKITRLYNNKKNETIELYNQNKDKLLQSKVGKATIERVDNARKKYNEYSDVARKKYNEYSGNVNDLYRDKRNKFNDLKEKHFGADSRNGKMIRDAKEKAKSFGNLVRNTADKYGLTDKSKLKALDTKLGNAYDKTVVGVGKTVKGVDGFLSGRGFAANAFRAIGNMALGQKPTWERDEKKVAEKEAKKMAKKHFKATGQQLDIARLTNDIRYDKQYGTNFSGNAGAYAVALPRNGRPNVSGSITGSDERRRARSDAARNRNTDTNAINEPRQLQQQRRLEQQRQQQQQSGSITANNQANTAATAANTQQATLGSGAPKSSVGSGSGGGGSSSGEVISVRVKNSEGVDSIVNAQTNTTTTLQTVHEAMAAAIRDASMLQRDEMGKFTEGTRSGREAQVQAQKEVATIVRETKEAISKTGNETGRNLQVISQNTDPQRVQQATNQVRDAVSEGNDITQAGNNLLVTQNKLLTFIAKWFGLQPDEQKKASRLKTLLGMGVVGGVGYGMTKLDDMKKWLDEKAGNVKAAWEEAKKESGVGEAGTELKAATGAFAKAFASGEAGKIMGEWWENTKEFFTGAKDGSWTDVLANLMSKIKDFIDEFNFAEFITNIKMWFSSIDFSFSSIIKSVKGALEGVWSLVKVLWNAIKGIAGAIFEFGKSLFGLASGLIEHLAPIVSKLFAFMVSNFKMMIKFLEPVVSFIGTTLKFAINLFADGIKLFSNILIGVIKFIRNSPIGKLLGIEEKASESQVDKIAQMATEKGIKTSNTKIVEELRLTREQQEKAEQEKAALARKQSEAHLKKMLENNSISEEMYKQQMSALQAQEEGNKTLKQSLALQKEAMKTETGLELNKFSDTDFASFEDYKKGQIALGRFESDESSFAEWSAARDATFGSSEDVFLRIRAAHEAKEESKRKYDKFGNMSDVGVRKETFETLANSLSEDGFLGRYGETLDADVVAYLIAKGVDVSKLKGTGEVNIIKAARKLGHNVGFGDEYLEYKNNKGNLKYNFANQALVSSMLAYQSRDSHEGMFGRNSHIYGDTIGKSLTQDINRLAQQSNTNIDMNVERLQMSAQAKTDADIAISAEFIEKIGNKYRRNGSVRAEDIDAYNRETMAFFASKGRKELAKNYLLTPKPTAKTESAASELSPSSNLYDHKAIGGKIGATQPVIINNIQQPQQPVQVQPQVIQAGAKQQPTADEGLHFLTDNTTAVGMSRLGASIGK